MFDDRKSDLQYAVVLLPNIPGGLVTQMSYVDASKYVGGFADQQQYQFRNIDLLLYYANKRAYCMGEPPNRLIDEIPIYGKIVIFGLDEPFTEAQAKKIADFIDWRMVQMEVAV